MVYQQYPSPNDGSTARGQRSRECDIGQLLELFVRLTNVTKARIALSPSLKVHQALIRWGEDTEGSMMGL